MIYLIFLFFEQFLWLFQPFIHKYFNFVCKKNTHLKLKKSLFFNNFKHVLYIFFKVTVFLIKRQNVILFYQINLKIVKF